MKKRMILSSTLLMIFFINACSTTSLLNPTPSNSALSLDEIEGSNDVPVDSSFSYTFSSAVDTSMVDAASFFIIPATPSSNIASPTKAAYDATTCDATNALSASISCISATECVLDPTSDLSEGTPYTVCILPSIEYSDASWSLFINKAFAAEDFDGASFSFSTTGEPAIPDVSGVYIDSAEDDCFGDTVFTASGTDNIYDFDGETLTMTGSTTCTVILEDKDDDDAEISCSYEENQFTMVVTEEEWTCTSILTKTDAVCGDGTCSYEDGENGENCPSDCSIVISSIAFLDDHNWSTTSPANDCLVDASDRDDFIFENDEDNAEEENAFETYYASLGPEYFMRINRTLDGSYCFIQMQDYDDNYTRSCFNISACNSNHIIATCELMNGDYCTINLE